MNTGLFHSFVLGGFECSTHRLKNGKRLDLLRATRHDELASNDYRALQQHGIWSARDGLRWHLIERSPGQYDFASSVRMLRAARDTGMQVIWDLWHYPERPVRARPVRPALRCRGNGRSDVWGCRAAAQARRRNRHVAPCALGGRRRPSGAVPAIARAIHPTASEAMSNLCETLWFDQTRC